MARDFNGSSDRAQNSSLALQPPLTMGCWFYPDNPATFECLLQLVDTAVDFKWHALLLSASGGGTVSQQSFGSSGAIATTANTYTQSAWNFALGTVASGGTSRTVQLNGGTVASESTTQNPTGLDQWNVAARWRRDLSAYNPYFNGLIAEAFLYDVELSADEKAALARGTSPLLIRRSSLVHYSRMLGRSSPEPDYVGAYNLTLTGTAQAEHPRIIVSEGPKLIIPTTQGLGIPIASYHYHHHIGA